MSAKNPVSLLPYYLQVAVFPICQLRSASEDDRNELGWELSGVVGDRAPVAWEQSWHLREKSWKFCLWKCNKRNLHGTKQLTFSHPHDPGPKGDLELDRTVVTEGMSSVLNPTL